MPLFVADLIAQTIDLMKARKKTPGSESYSDTVFSYKCIANSSTYINDRKNCLLTVPNWVYYFMLKFTLNRLQGGEKFKFIELIYSG